MNINNEFPSKWLKADDLGGKEVKVTIEGVNREEVGSNNDTKPVVYFKGHDKGVVLNKTNAQNIADTYGPETDGWTGKDVILFTTWVDFQGKSVEAIRIRPAKSGEKAKPLPVQENSENPAEDMDDDIPF